MLIGIRLSIVPGFMCHTSYLLLLVFALLPIEICTNGALPLYIGAKTADVKCGT